MRHAELSSIIHRLYERVRNLLFSTRSSPEHVRSVTIRELVPSQTEPSVVPQFAGHTANYIYTVW